MKFKNSNDNKYRARFMRATEALMDRLTVKEFIQYLEENGIFVDYMIEYIDGRYINSTIYALKEENSKLHKEFIMTEDGRLFYWPALSYKTELVDDK